MLKKALLVGLNKYPLRSLNLRGCVNDVRHMKEVLTDLFNFAPDSIRLLLDREATKKNIVTGLKWLAEGGSETAVRVFHYAGHGYALPDRNGDEEDGADEALVPYDFLEHGFLIDDVLKRHYARFPKNGNLTLIMDCCHSGTIQRDPVQDVRYRFMPNSYRERKAIAAASRKFRKEQQEHVVTALADLRGRKISDEEFQQRVRDAMRQFEKQRFGGDFKLREGNVLLAACHSSQQAADAKFGRDYHGAFTFFLTKILRAKRGRLTHRELIEKLGKALHELDFPQIPQLECNRGREKAKLFSAF
ncbi:MAG: caspase family protein [bacterium]